LVFDTTRKIDTEKGLYNQFLKLTYKKWLIFSRSQGIIP
jgi:hypothetical protein